MKKSELKRIQKALNHQYQVSLKFNGNIIVIGKDPDNPKKNIYYCIQHDEYFSSLPTKMLIDSRKGCLICSGREIWTTDSVIKRIQFLNQDEFGNNTLLIDSFEYKQMHQEIWLTCIIDGHRWKAEITTLIHGDHGCRMCSNRNKNNHLRISFDDLHGRNNEINTDENGVLRVIIRCTRKWYEKKYKGNVTKIPVGCNNPDHPDWEVRVAALLNRETGCPTCAGTLKLTIEDFFNKIPDIFLNQNGLPLHKFNLNSFDGLSSFIWIFDPDYGWFKKSVSMYLQGYGHPNSPKTKSKGELAIQEFLLVNQIKFIREYRIPELIRLRVDFFLIEQGIAIEFDGPQHLEYIPWIHRNEYANFEKQQQNDSQKDHWCQDNNIQMIRITNIKDIPLQLNFLIKGEKKFALY